MPHDFQADLAAHEAEITGDIIDQVVAIARAGHERTMRQNGCPLAIRMWADTDTVNNSPEYLAAIEEFNSEKRFVERQSGGWDRGE